MPILFVMVGQLEAGMRYVPETIKTSRMLSLIAKLTTQWTQ